MARLHARGVPTLKDNNRCITVGVVSVPAGGTDERRLVFAAFTVRSATGAAGLRGIGRIDLDQVSGLVGEHGFDLMPTNVENGAIESTLLRDVASWCLDSSRRASGHVLCAQAFNNYCAVATADFRGGGMRPILADTSLTGFQLGYAALRLGVANGAAFAAAGDALGFADSAVNGGDAGRKRVACAIGQHNRNADAAIYSDTSGRTRRVSSVLAAEADLPAKGGFGNSSFGNVAAQRTCVTEFNPANLWELHPRPASVNLVDQYSASGEREGIVDALALKLRIAALATPRANERPIEGLQSTLLRLLRSKAHKVNFSAQLRQLARLSNVIEIITCASLKVAPVVKSLFQRKVPNQTANSSELIEQYSLFICRA